MSSSEVSLLQMPEIPMKNILEYLDFPSILVLRKVCHDLRNFIEDTKPASYLKEVYISWYPEFIQICLESQAQNKICIYYEECDEGCCLIKKDNEDAEKKATTLNNEDFLTVFCKDFDIILRHQKTVLEYFEIYPNTLNSTVNERVLINVRKVFKSMNHLLQVKSLYIQASNHSEILSILPYIDPKSLKEIHISELSGEGNAVLNLDEIGQLEQWKQAEELSIRGFQLPDLSQKIKHFSSIDLGFREVPIEELILLKEIFLCSVTLNKIEVYIDDRCSAVVGPRLIERFGEPFEVNQDRNWFFRIPNTNQFLRIKLNSVDIHFNRIEQSDVPQNAIILN